MQRGFFTTIKKNYNTSITTAKTAKDRRSSTGVYCEIGANY